MGHERSSSTHAKGNSLNAYLKTEDDVKVRFGGYLVEVFRQERQRVDRAHPIALYPQSIETADLSIH